MSVEKSEKKAKRKKKKSGQILAYPIPIRGEKTPSILQTLKYLHQKENEYLKACYEKEVLEELANSSRKAYKVLEPIAKNKGLTNLPSRVNRGILEVVGRNLRAINDRREVFDALMKLPEAPEKWDYKKLIKEQNEYQKSQYVANIKEQTLNYVKEHQKMPEDYFVLQSCPKIHDAIISYAPDDGQALQIKRQADSLHVKIKVIVSTENEEIKWDWIELSLPLPEHLKDRPMAAPDMRLACVHGEWLPVLDYKTNSRYEEKHKSEYFLTVDWGARKLVTVCAFDRKGQQISVPIFLQFTPLQNKLQRIRCHIDNLKSKRDSLNDTECPKFKSYNREIAKHWRKFRAIQKALSHLASNVIVLIAQLYGCSSIYVEWLKSLKSQSRCSQKNWVVNTTVRQAIYDKVEYKAKLIGLTFAKPVPPAGTSQYCPRCGSKGIHVKASDNLLPCKTGGWFICTNNNCKFQADRDYVATCNIARKVLYGNSLKNLHKGVVYTKTPIPVLLTRQGICSPREQLAHSMKGWKNSIFLSLQKSLFCGTLKA